MKRHITTYPMAQRQNLVKLADFGRLPRQEFSVRPLIDALPNIHAGNTIRQILEAISKARKAGRPFLLGMGAHVIKCGLAPFLIAMIERKIVTGIALNGAGAIHDFELAAFGETSEDVAKELKAGRFGCVEETGAWMNEAIKLGAATGKGLGQALYSYIEAHQQRFPNRELSILWQCGQHKIPCTVHVAIGTDFIHLHPDCDGAAIGATTFCDFEIFCEQVEQLEHGIYWNLGSAVVLPEVFLKAVSRAHNLGYSLEGMTTINTDQIPQYRALTNVVKRPSLGVGNGFHLTGHHEIIVPLITLTLLEDLNQCNLSPVHD